MEVKDGGKRWREHFKKLLNTEMHVHEETTNNGEIEINWESGLGQITWEEMEIAVKKMNGGKGPGPDEVSVDLSGWNLDYSHTTILMAKIWGKSAAYIRAKTVYR